MLQITSLSSSGVDRRENSKLALDVIITAYFSHDDVVEEAGHVSEDGDDAR